MLVFGDTVADFENFAETERHYLIPGRAVLTVYVRINCLAACLKALADVGKLPKCKRL